MVYWSWMVPLFVAIWAGWLDTKCPLTFQIYSWLATISLLVTSQTISLFIPTCIVFTSFWYSFFFISTCNIFLTAMMAKNLEEPCSRKWTQILKLVYNVIGQPDPTPPYSDSAVNTSWTTTLLYALRSTTPLSLVLVISRNCAKVCSLIG